MSERIDNEETGVRFGCGLIAGAGVSFCALVSWLPLSTLFWVLVVAGAIIFATLAVRYGDEAW